MRVRDVMTRDPQCCLPDASIAAVARMMVQCDCGAIPVVGDLIARLPIGMVTDRDIVTRVIAAGYDPAGLVARDCMSVPAVTIVESARLRDCIGLLELTQIRRVIVIGTSGRCIGIVSQADIARHTSKRLAGDLVREVSKPTTAVFST